MGLFSSSKKFSEMQTPEQKYLASGSYQATTQATKASSADRTARYRRDRRREQAQIDTDSRRSQVTKTGKLTRRGRSVVLTGGWQFATDKLPKGNLNGMEFEGDKLGDLSVKDLHDLADNHGPNCRCGLGR